jgi:hypothetical protein
MLTLWFLLTGSFNLAAGTFVTTPLQPTSNLYEYGLWTFGAAEGGLLQKQRKPLQLVSSCTDMMRAKSCRSLSILRRGCRFLYVG